MCNDQHVYTKEEEEYILKYYSICNTKAIAKQLKVTGASVGSKAWALGIIKSVVRSKKQPPAFKKEQQIDDEPFFGNPGHIYQYQQPKPRKNWFQCILSWLLTGEA